MNAAPAPLADAQHPWIGLSSFTEGDQAFFAGRGEEIDELLRLVKRDTLTLLYGVSGLGKTSLLQAGLFPAVRAEDWLPVSLRLDYSEGAPPLAAQVLGAITTAASAAKVEAPLSRPGETLWEYFHREGNHFWSSRNDLVTPFLVVDQFEEAFTLGRETPERARLVAEFISELADLAENRPPAALRDDPQRAREFGFKPVPLKILLAMREDYLADLDRIRSQFRALGQNRLRLLPMGAPQARQVIELGTTLLAPGVADRLISFVAWSAAPLDGSELAVAPALLSLVLRELNERRLQRGPDSQITPDLLDVEQQKILEDFYLRTVRDFPAGVRDFIEDELLTASGYRDSCALDDALARPDVTPAVLDELVNRRLLAYEDRHHVRRVEITHDVLAPVVKVSRDTRVAREALAAEARKNAEARDKERIVQRVQTTLLALLLLVCSTSLLYTVYVGKRSDRGSRWLGAIYQEVKKEAPASPDRAKIAEAQRQLALLAKQATPDSKGFYGNVRLYADMSRIADELAQGNPPGPRDQLLAQIFETLESQKSDPTQTLEDANGIYKTLADNRQADVARFVIENYRREDNKSSILLQALSLLAVFVVVPTWIIRRFLGRESLLKRFGRRRKSGIAIEKRPNPFLRLFAAFADGLIALSVGILATCLCTQLVGILSLWVNGEVSDTGWGFGSAAGLVACLVGSGAYLIFSDAIQYTHRRSIGKIMCRLIPVTLQPDGGEVSLKVSAKRNALPALVFLLMALAAFSPSANSPTLEIVRGWADTFETLKNLGDMLLLILTVEEFTLCWIRDGRTLLDRFSGTKVIREP